MPIDVEIVNAIKPQKPPKKADAASTAADEDEYDRRLVQGNKRHRNLKASFDHWYIIFTHPFCLILCCTIVLLIFAATRYIARFTGSVVFENMSRDFGLALTYIATTVVSSVFTKFLDAKRDV
jgi:hypothetical protein